MDDWKARIGRISATKRELLERMLRAKLRLDGAVGALAISATAMSVETLRAQAQLSDRIDPFHARAAADGEAREILLTGATGFLGSFLLSALLAHTKARIHCLVRASDDHTAFAGIARTLALYRLPVADPGRIVPVLGDLTQPSFGLLATDYDRVADRIEVIHHCGAMVKWTYPYTALQAANVGGTQEILRLACTARVKPVHFISTVGVFSSPEYTQAAVLETEPLENSGPLYVGYAQTKWVAETLVRLAGERGLPVTIYRPNTGPDSRTGAFNQNDHLSQMVRGCIQLRAAPDLAWQISGAPIDFVANAIVRLSQRPESVGRTYHLVNPTDCNWTSLVGWIQRIGYQMETLPPEVWRDRLTSAVVTSRSTALASLSPLFSEGIVDKVRLPAFDQQITARELRRSGLDCPPPGIEQFSRCLNYFVATNFVEPPCGRQTSLSEVASRAVTSSADRQQVMRALR